MKHRKILISLHLAEELYDALDRERSVIQDYEGVLVTDTELLHRAVGVYTRTSIKHLKFRKPKVSKGVSVKKFTSTNEGDQLDKYKEALGYAITFRDHGYYSKQVDAVRQNIKLAVDMVKAGLIPQPEGFIEFIKLNEELEPQKDTDKADKND